MPGSVTSIGNSAFSGCTSLRSVIIPDSLTSIGNSAFSGCISLISVMIPESVTSIGDWAFSECFSLTSITIPGSVASIGYEAFEGLTFYNEDSSTILEHTLGNLSGNSFAGTFDRLVRGHHTITYDVVGGSASAPIQSNLAEGDSFIITTYYGTKDGYVFRGWTDGTDVYAAGDTYAVGTSDVTLTAVWEAPAETSTISGFAIAIVAMVLVAVLYGRRS